MRVILFACAESASIDAATNRLSIFHFLDEIHSPIFPAAYPGMTLIALAAREEAEPNNFSFTLKIFLSGQEQPLFQGPFLFDFQNRLRSRALAQIAGLVVPGPGTLRFEILDGEKQIGIWETFVVRIGEPQIVPQPTGPTGPSAQTSKADS
jgi:hypothetical protein